MSDCVKCRRSKSDSLVGCEGPCARWVHHSCVGLTGSDFKTIQKLKNLFYVCDSCHRKYHVVGTATSVNKLKDSVNIDSYLVALKDFNKDILNFLRINLILSIRNKKINDCFTLFKYDICNG